MSRAARSAVILLFALCVAGCTSGSSYVFDAPQTRLDTLFGLTNVRVLAKGPLVARSVVGDKDTYAFVLLGSPTTPYDGVFNLIVTLPNGQVLNLASAGAIDAIRAAIPGYQGPTDGGIQWDHFDGVTGSREYWPSGTERLQLAYSAFYARDNNLLGLSIQLGPREARRSDSTALPKLGTSPDKLLSVPFSGAEYMEVFGEPDNVYEYFSF